MYRSLLVPLDGSPFGEHALPVAAAIARRSGASLEVAYVHPPTVVGEAMDLGPPDAQAWQAARNYLESVINRLGSGTDLRAKACVLDGPVVDTLEGHAVSGGFDLVVMTTHGHGPFSRFWLGSVADQLVRRLPMPVLLVRPQTTQADFDQEPAFRHVLIALDGSARAEEILGPAVGLGRLTGASYTLLRVVVPPPIVGLHVTGYAAAGFDLTAVERAEGEALSYLGRLADRIRGEGCVVHPLVSIDPYPASAVLEAASRQACDLIALETRGRAGLKRLFLGSVADKVLRGAKVAVLLHRTPAHAPGK